MPVALPEFAASRHPKAAVKCPSSFMVCFRCMHDYEETIALSENCKMVSRFRATEQGTTEVRGELRRAVGNFT